MQFTNVELASDYEKKGQSFVVIMGHYASYEWLTALQFWLKNDGHGIYKRIRNPYYDKLVHRIRSRWNTNMIPNKTIRRIMDRQIKDGVVTSYGFIADQSPRKPNSQQWFTFLGKDLPFYTGVERIAVDFNLPVLHLSVRKIKRGYYQGTFTLLAEEPNKLAKNELTTAFVKQLEQQILEQPEYYLWTHNRFKHFGKRD